MKCFTPDEELAWLAEHHIQAAPYEHGGQCFAFYLQFYSPKSFRGVAAFTQNVLSAICEGGETLLSIADTEQPKSYELRLIERLRSASQESRSIGKAPGHLFSSAEEDDAVAMFSLTVAMGWEAYLYMPKTSSVVFNWEGDILDFWTSKRSVFEEVTRLIAVFGLQETLKPSSDYEHPVSND